MSALKHRRKVTTCPNCGTVLSAKMNFCPSCGQENHSLKIPLGHLLYEFVEGIFHFDTKFWTTAKAIFTRPGQITKDFVEGRRARHVPPVRLYIFISFVFFLLVSALSDESLEAVNEATSSPEVLRKAFAGELAKYTRATDSVLAGRVVALRTSRREAFFDSLDTRLSKEKKNRLLYSVADWQAYVQRQLAYQVRQEAGADSVYRVTLDSQKVTIGTYSGGSNDDLPFSTTVPRRDLLKIKTYTNQQIDSVLTANNEKPSWFTRTAVRQAARFVTNDNRQETVREQGRELVHKVVKNASIMMFVLMPVVAFLLLGIYYRRKRFYYEHLIFSVHLHAVVFLIFSMAFVVWLGTHYAGAFGWASLLAWVYILLSLKTVYGQGWLKTILKFFLLSFSYFLCFSMLFVLTSFVSFLTF